MTEPRIEAKATLMDWDDAVVYTRKPIWALHKYVAKEHYGIELKDEDIRPHWGKPLEKLVKIMYQTEDHLAAFEILSTYKALPEYQKILVDPTHEAIQNLRKKTKLGIVTAHVRELMDIDFAYLDFPSEYLDYIQTSDDTEFHKPDPRVFEPALEWLDGLGISAHETIYTGDSLGDMQAALGAGMQFIGVETGLVGHDEFAAAGALSVPTIVEVAPLVF